MNKIMENNEQFEETQEEETQETATSAEQTEEQEEDGQEETKDWKAEALKYKAIAERKDKKLQEKSEVKTKELNKNNTEQSGLSREEAIFFAKGGTEEDLAIANKIAKVEGISLLAAMEDDFYKAQVEKRQAEAQAKANKLGASSGSPTNSQKKQKPVSKMTREEHIEYAKQKIQGLNG